MLRNASLGALAFGLSAAVAGYVWTAFEFPFAILLPAFVGWYAVVRHEYGHAKALRAAAVGGLTFTGLFMVGMFLAITDGSPVAVTGWLAAVLAAIVAGGLTGAVIDGVRAALPIASFSAVGMLVSTTVATLMRGLTPAAADVPGVVQSSYVALSLGLVGLFVGAAVGAGIVWVKRHSSMIHPEDSGMTSHRVHPA